MINLAYDFSDSGKETARQLPGSGRPLKSKDFDDEMATWVRSQRSKKLRVSRRMIQREALRLTKFHFDDENDEDVEFKVN